MEPAWPLLVAVGGASGIVALVVAALARNLARRLDLLDHPNQRSSHVAPTPRLGGLGILAALGPGLAAAWWLGLSGRDATALLVVCSIAAGVGLVSLLDDLWGLSSALRFATHLAGAALLVATLGALPAVTAWGSTIPLGWLGGPLAVLWIAGFTNAFNFMDGIDGIAGAQALVAGVAWAALGLLLDEPALAWGGTLVAGGAAGFLVLNWSPATVFMGDVGSALLGSLLAALPLAARHPSRVAVPAVLLVSPFVFDAAITILRRASRGENIFVAHRSHLYQRLTAAGWSHAGTSALYAAIAGVGAVAAYLHVAGAPAAAPALAALGLALAGLWLLVIRTERRSRLQPVGVSGHGRTDLA